MSKDTDTWMPFVVSRYLQDTMHLSTEQHGGYLLLLLHAWTHGGLLPADDEKLRRITRMLPEAWESQKDDIKAFFTESDGALRQKRLDEELARAERNVAQRTEAGKASAAARKAQRKGNERSNGRSSGRSDERSNGGGNGSGNAAPTTVPETSPDEGEPPGNSDENGANPNEINENATAVERALQRDHQRNGRPIPIPISPSEITPRSAPQGGDDGLGTADADDPVEGGRGDPPPATPTLPPGTAGAYCRALREAGISRVSPDNQDLLSLIAVGATVAELVALVPDALKADEPFTYLLATAKRKRMRAARDMTAMHRGAMPAPQAPPAESAYERRMREQYLAIAPSVAAKQPAPAQPADFIDMPTTEVFDAPKRLR